MSKIILLNGPSSSGKSSLSKALKELVLNETGKQYEVISIDDFMKTDPNETIYEDDVYEISGEMCDSIRELISKDIGVIIDHVITSERIYEQLIDSVKGYEFYTVHITCPIEVLRQREQERGDRCRGSAEASLTYLFPKEGYDITVDTGSYASSECAGQIFDGIFRSK
jgi:chloramphenicol 3-O phosphotransferase